jgi:hypothetical protein
MAKQTIELGGIVKSEVKKINDNFTELYNAEATGNKSNNLSDYNNDAGFVTAAAVPTVPENVSEFTNDAGYQTAAQVTAAVTAGVANKVDKITGKDLSTNDYTTDDKNKVARLGKIDFTTSDFGALQTDGYMYATISAGGKYPVKVFKQNGTKYEEVLAQADVDGNNIVIGSCSAFNGYVVTV